MLKRMILANKFGNNSYFQDLKRYIKESIEKDNLSYDNLKYLYNNLYKGKSNFIKQNIYPVCEFLKKGYTFTECEKLASILKDANGLTVFCNNQKEIGNISNKLFCDLIFIYDNYDKYIKKGDSKDLAYNKTKYQLEITDDTQRQIEIYIKEDELMTISEVELYSKYIKDLRKELKQEIKKNTQDFKKINKYNRLGETITKLNTYKKAKYKSNEINKKSQL